MGVKNKVLVLNASYEPLNVCNWKRAVVLVFKGKAEQVEHNGKVIYHDFTVPTVIRLRGYVKIPHKQVPLTRRNLMHRDNHMCQYCGIKNTPLTIDHIIPKSRGGKDSWNNVVVCCQDCNVKKADKTPKKAGMRLLKEPRAPIGHTCFEITRLAVDNFPHWQKYIIGMSA